MNKYYRFCPRFKIGDIVRIKEDITVEEILTKNTIILSKDTLARVDYVGRDIAEVLLVVEGNTYQQIPEYLLTLEKVAL